MISSLGVALCAALAMRWSFRLLVLVHDARAAAAMQRRLRADLRPRIIEQLRLRFDVVAVRLAAVVDRLSGSSRARQRIDRTVLTLLESVTRSLRSGASLRTAVAAASADSPDLIDRELAASLVDGISLRSALDTWMRDATASRVLVGTALRLAAESGGAVASVLDGVAESVRDRRHLDREVVALASQARASAMVLIVAPILFALLMATIDPRVARFQFGSPLGWGCCVIGLLLDLAGAFWMSRMIGRVR
jgi:Flp pilus assembly protein TadB